MFTIERLCSDGSGKHRTITSVVHIPLCSKDMNVHCIVHSKVWIVVCVAVLHTCPGEVPLVAMLSTGTIAGHVAYTMDEMWIWICVCIYRYFLWIKNTFIYKNTHKHIYIYIYIYICV